MDLDLLARTFVDWEQRGQLEPGEGIVVGRHEPEPVPGGLRVGGTDAGGRSLVEAYADGAWSVLRRYDTVEGAAGHVFDRLGSLTASRSWGPEAWAAIRAKVHEGSVLRSAALLLWPEADLNPDRWDLVERLRALGVPPERYWVEGVEGQPPPDELTTQLRRDGDAWVIGADERGAFHEVARFRDEADACRRAFRDVFASGTCVDMGFDTDRPTIVPAHRRAVRAALAEALALLDEAEAEAAGA